MKVIPWLAHLGSSVALISTATLSMAAQDKHIHGEAELYIAMDDQQLLIELTSPAANIVGFEHKPRTKAQRTALHKAMDTLASYQSVITFSMGDCQQVEQNIKSAFDGHDKHHGQNEHSGHHHDHDNEHDHDEHDHHQHHEEVHSDFQISYRLTCKSISDIKQVDITAFKSFPGIENINISWVTPSGQGGLKTTRHKTQITF